MLEIIVVPVGKAGQFSAMVDGQVIVASSRTPFLTAARVLLAEGLPPSTDISVRHASSATASLKSTVGTAARMTVKETDTRGPSFDRYQPPQDARLLARLSTAHAFKPEAACK